MGSAQRLAQGGSHELVTLIVDTLESHVHVPDPQCSPRWLLRPILSPRGLQILAKIQLTTTHLLMPTMCQAPSRALGAWC